MACDIFMPRLGMTMTEGTVVRWLKRPGDPIARGEPIFEVETDKVVQEVNSLDEGVLGQILVGEGMPVPVGTVIARLAGELSGTRGNSGELGGTQGNSGGLGGARRTQSSVPSPQSSVLSTQHAALAVRSSPAARRLAEKLGVDIRTVRGTGPTGRIIEEDVRRAAAEGTTAGAASSIPPSPRPPVPPSPGPRMELRGMRKVVAERMAHSFSTAPHFYLTVEVDAGPLVALHGQIVAVAKKRGGVEPTITDLVIKAAAVALREHPEANAAWAEGAVRFNPEVNLGVAAAVGDGLIVPVISGADTLSISEIAQRRGALVERARAGHLTLPELEGGTFTISNLGMFGIDLFQAIVNPPQAAILAVGRIKDRVVAVDGQAVVRPTMFVTLSSDHRLLDGATAARFLARVVELLERPVELVT